MRPRARETPQIPRERSTCLTALSICLQVHPLVESSLQVLVEGRVDEKKRRVDVLGVDERQNQLSQLGMWKMVCVYV